MVIKNANIYILVDAYIRRLHVGIDRAMAVVYRSQKRHPYVARITLCRGIPFYGFHVGYRFYLKIYLLNPSRISRLADLLRGGAVGRQFFQPYEAHIPYILGFMIDFNLYGCGFVDCENVKFRTPIPSAEDVGPDALWNDETIGSDMLLPEDEFPRLSYCTLEVDVQIQDILNQRQITPRLLHHNFIERTNPLPPDVKLVHSLAELWRDDARRRGLAGQSSTDVPPMTSSSRDISTRWIHEDEYMEKIRDIIDDERQRASKPFSGFDNFVRRKPFEGLVKTVMDSVKDFFPENQSEYGVFIGPPDAETIRNIEEDVEIDEDLINQVVAEAEEGGDFVDDMDAPASEGSEELVMGVQSEQVIPTPMMDQDSTGRLVSTKRQLITGNLHVASSVFLEEGDFDIPMEFYSKTSPKRLASPIDLNPTPVKIRKFDLSYPLTSRSSNNGVSVPKVPSDQSLLNGYPIVKSPTPKTTLPLTQEKTPQNSLVGKITSACSSKLPPTLGSLFSSSANLDLMITGQFPYFPFLILHMLNDVLLEKRTIPIISKVEEAFDSALFCTTLCYDKLAPSDSELAITMESIGLPPKMYQGAYYSNEKDVPPRPREYAGREFKLQSNTVPFLPDFNPTGDLSSVLRTYNPESKPLPSFRVWEIEQPPPSRADTDHWLEELKVKSIKNMGEIPNRQILSQVG